MPDLSHEFKKFQLLLKHSKKVCIISHRSPDGDTIGSNFALRYALESMGKEVFSVCADPVPETFLFLPDSSACRQQLQISQYDLIVTVDTAARSLIGFEHQHKELFAFYPLVNIDHHPDNQLFGNLNIVDDSAASATMVLFALFKSLKIPITKDMATAMLLGLYSDTGSFMHANTSQNTYQVASQLLSYGANAQLIVQRLFKYFPVNRLHLWGEVFRRAKVNPQQVVSSVVTKEDFRKTATNGEDLSGVVEYLNMVPDSKFAMLLTEDMKRPQVKASLRTLQDDVDVSAIAHRFGGGGHKKASGFRIPGKIEEETTWKIVNDKNEQVMDDSDEM